MFTILAASHPNWYGLGSLYTNSLREATTLDEIRLFVFPLSIMISRILPLTIALVLNRLCLRASLEDLAAGKPDAIHTLDVHHHLHMLLHCNPIVPLQLCYLTLRHIFHIC